MQFTLSGKFTTNCSGVTAVDHSWSILKLMPDSSEESLNPHYFAASDTWVEPDVRILKDRLEVGKYKLVFNVR